MICSRFAVGVVAAATTFGPAQAQEERPGLGTHEHGVTVLAIGLDGDAVTVALEAPAGDLAGVEYPPSTGLERERAAAALAALNEPLRLLALPAAAGCTVAEATVAQAFEQNPEMPAGPMDEHAHMEETPDAVHSELHAGWRLACADPAALTTIGFPYFELFPRVDAVAVTVTTAAGETTFEVLRASPELSLAAILAGGREPVPDHRAMPGMHAEMSPASQAYMDAMQAMMDEMDAKPMTGDPSIDFAQMMIPHHQSAIDMAQAYLQAAETDPELRQLAEEIIAAQEREIAFLEGWLAQRR